MEWFSVSPISNLVPVVSDLPLSLSLSYVSLVFLTSLSLSLSVLCIPTVSDLALLSLSYVSLLFLTSLSLCLSVLCIPVSDVCLSLSYVPLSCIQYHVCFVRCLVYVLLCRCV